MVSSVLADATVFFVPRVKDTVFSLSLTTPTNPLLILLSKIALLSGEWENRQNKAARGACGCGKGVVLRIGGSLGISSGSFCRVASWTYKDVGRPRERLREREKWGCVYGPGCGEVAGDLRGVEGGGRTSPLSQLDPALRSTQAECLLNPTPPTPPSPTPSPSCFS